MIIHVADGVAWFGEGYEPSADERHVLSVVTEHLPNPPLRIRVNSVCEYVLVADGFEGFILGPKAGQMHKRWVEYHFNVQSESPLPILKEA